MSDSRRELIAMAMRGWDAIDDKRTGTPGDRQTADWLADAVWEQGLPPNIESFELRRFIPRDCSVAIRTAKVEGVPAFDGATTSTAGVTARLGDLVDAAAGIGLGVVGGAADPVANQAFAAARREGGRSALVAVTKGHANVPGLALQNADRFTAPFGPPVVQVGSEHEQWLRAAAAAGERATVTAQVDRVPALGFNVSARVPGRDPALAPLVVMTPKSAWWVCTAERGGGIAVWLALAGHFAKAVPDRTVVFVATSGHELGHLGLDSFLAANAGLGGSAHAWLHLGANFATAGGDVRLQASDAGLLALARAAMEDAGQAPDAMTPLDQRPGGEARNIHDLDGRYVSFLGTNPWFHHRADRWPTTVNVAKTERLAAAVTVVAERLSQA